MESTTKFKTVTFVSQLMAEQQVPHPNVAVVSIVAPGDEPAKIKDGFHGIVRLWMDDLYEEGLEIRLGSVPDLDPTEEKSRVLWHHLSLPNYNHAKEIVDFLNAITCDHILVHCHAGISRSAAVAQFISDKYGARINTDWCDTSCMNKRLYRLLCKAHAGEEPTSFKYIVRDEDKVEPDNYEVQWIKAQRKWF